MTKKTPSKREGAKTKLKPTDLNMKAIIPAMQHFVANLHSKPGTDNAVDPASRYFQAKQIIIIK